MNCAEARRLLNAGVVPGASGNRDPFLGFHLAGCSGCRRFRDRLDSRLLAELLAAEPGSVFNVKTQRRKERNGLNAKTQRRKELIERQARVDDHLVHRSSFTSSPRHPSRFSILNSQFSIPVALLLSLLFVGWWFGLPLLRAAAHLQVMYSPPLPVAPVASATPSLAARAAVLLAATPLPPGPVFALAPAPTVRAGMLRVPTALPATVLPTPPPTPQPTATPELPAVAAKTILLLGLDARPGEGLNARSDALMLARLDPERGDIALLSLPRDLWTAIPGFGESKINAAFFFGSRQMGSGLQLAKQTVSGALGIPIDYAVAIDFAGFRSLVDTIGGISVDVPVELYDGSFPTDDYGYMVAHFLPGPQTMDGARALVYARTRHPDSDFERMKRQQLVLLGILQRIRERGALANLHEADTLTAALQPFVHTDVPPAEALALVWRLRDLDGAAVRRFSVDASMLYTSSASGSFALIAPDGVLAEMGRKLLEPASP